ncbi:MAG: glycosyltransferase family 2 protein [Caulobacterales bacterium]|nr:glycosyltransferase family 2 protein [Caulobacterales bacterium]MCA0371650.1 glycosyltransferase family 2 protein [Pseudomonadota bacterium]
MTSLQQNQKLDISIVVPVHNESGAIAILIDEINNALDGYDFEIIIINDKSKDNTLEVLQNLKPKYPRLRVLNHNKNAGQSRAIYSGVQAANAPIIGTLDGDGQNDPKDLPKLLRQLLRNDAPSNLAMVQGMRLKRQDTKAKKIASKFANNVRQTLLKDGAIDSGCGIKVVKRDAFLALPYFDHMHRYMAALLHQAGFAVEFSEVNHRARETGASKYTNIGRLLAAFTDLFGVIWLGTRRKDNGGFEEV